MSIESYDQLLALKHVGRAVEREVRRRGFSVIRALCGHGIGRTIHEAPSAINYRNLASRERLTPGLVITVEPIIAMGQGRCAPADDGWTERTVDGSLAAHFEHTIVITGKAPVLITAA
jgi:methionyl aminopeptidase